MRLAALLAGAALTACAPMVELPSEPPLILEDQYGGNVVAHLRERKRIEEWGREVVLRGDIASAAIVYTTMERACLEPDARVGVHRPAIPDDVIDTAQVLASLVPGGNVGVTVADQFGDDFWVGVLALTLSGEARDRWLTEWVNVPSDQIMWIAAPNFVALEPRARLCPST